MAMKDFKIENEIEIEIKNQKYNFIKIDTEILMMSNEECIRKHKKELIVYLKGKINVLSNVNNLEDISGVYVFVLNKDFDVPEDFFYETTFIQKKGILDIKFENLKSKNAISLETMNSYSISSPKTEHFPEDNKLL